MTRFASLTAGLLARKGEAEPAATPFSEQILSRIGAPAADIQALTPMPHGNGHFHVRYSKEAEARDAFGRRVFHDVNAPPAEPEVDETGDNGCGSCSGQPGDQPGKTFHVNLRLKRARFVKLKLSAALLRRPVQDIVSEALDQWFATLPADIVGDCACMKVSGE